METPCTISELPTELLIEIFSYVPNRWNLSLVCWDFYEIVCEIERNKFNLKLIDLDDDEKFISIMATKRAFSAIKMINFRSPDYHVTRRLQDVFIKYADSIKSLEIASSILTEADVRNLLSTILNVEEITFYDIELSAVNNEAASNLYLNCLKTFNFRLCNVKVPNIILSLPHSVLKNLSIEHSILKEETLRLIFNSQRSIEELEFDPYYVNTQSMNHLKLTKVKLMCNRNVADILKNQEKLQSLDLSRSHIGDNEFHLVCNLLQLKSLKLWIDRVSHEILENLVQLRHLRELSLDYERLEVEYVRTISSISLPSVERLKIKFPRMKISTNSFKELSLNMPNIKHLTISNQSIGVIGAILEDFHNLETLVIVCDSDSPEVVDWAISRARRTKLKDLCIFNSYVSKNALKCSKTILEIVNLSLVNLEKLKLQNVITMSVDQLQDLFESHHKLTHFLIDSPEESFTFDETVVNLIKEQSSHLSFFQSTGAEIKIPKKQLEKEFGQHFPTIKIKPWKRQVTLRNQKWEHADD